MTALFEVRIFGGEMNQLALFDFQPEEAKPGAAAGKSTATQTQSTLQTAEIASVAKFAGLTREFKEAGKEVFGADLPGGLGAKISRLIAHLSIRGTSRLQIGLDAADIKADFKFEKQWVRCGEPIAKAAGFKRVTGLNNLIKDAQLAKRLPRALLAAVVESGLEPTEHRHAAYIKRLLARDFSGCPEEARTVVEETYTRWVAEKREAAQKKKEDEEAANKDSSRRIANQVAADLAKYPESERPERLEAIVHQVEAKAGKLVPGAKIHVLWSKDDIPDTPAEASTAPPAEIPCAEATADPVILNISSGLALVPRRTPAARAKCITQPGAPQPFGAVGATLNSLLGCSQCLRRCNRCDAAEDVLRFAQDQTLNSDKHFDHLVRLEGSATGRATFSGHINLYPDNLHEVLYLDPRIFMFPCCADLLDPALPKKVILEHFDVMRRASQHVFVIKTRNADRLREVVDWMHARYRALPHNIAMGVEVSGRHDFERIAKLGRTGLDLKWVDLSRWVPDERDEARILLDDELETLLRKSGIGWVMMGPRFAEPEKLGKIEKADLCFLLSQAKSAGCRVYFHRFEALEQQLRPHLARYGEEWSNGNLQIDELQQLPVFPPPRAANLLGFEPAFLPGEC